MTKQILGVKDLQCDIWLALDMDNFRTAHKLVGQISDLVTGYKVHGIVEDDLKNKIKMLRDNGAERIWYDRKIDDTPGTVKIVARNAKECGVQRMTAMASAGIEALMTAVKHGPPEIVAVTDLTSLSKAEIGMSRGMPADASVLQKAQWAKLAGIEKLVCSVDEVKILNSRRRYSELTGQHLELHGMKLIIPGSRTITNKLRGQVRSSTAMATLDAGADELVIGSEVWNHEDPAAALQELYQAMVANKKSA